MILIVLAGLLKEMIFRRDVLLLLVITDQGEKIMEIGARYAGKSFYDILKGVNEHIEIDKNGCGKFSVSENNISVWVML